MKVAIIGGTGKLGLGLAARLSRTHHEVMIGSREVSKAEEAARAAGARVSGAANAVAAQWSDLAFIAIPYSGRSALLEPLREQLQEKIVIDATVPMDPADPFQTKTESGQSAAEETAAALTGAEVFAAFQTVSHRVLRQYDVSYDVLVAGPPARKPEVTQLIRDMEFRPVDAGPLGSAGLLERMTLLLLSINKANKVKEASFKVVGV
jgi:NADPH-dependent F420 reductase